MAMVEWLRHSMGTKQRVRSLTDIMRRGDPSAWLGWRPRAFAASEILDLWKAALARPPGPGAPRTLQLYAHFAYCRVSCTFCQYFHAVPGAGTELDAYTEHMIALVRRYGDALGRIHGDNAYFGGGTPTALSADQLRRFLAAFGEVFHVAGEFSCEGHPSTLDEEKIDLLAAAGVNRMSMGIQSLDPEVLKVIHRANRPLDVMAAQVHAAQRHGIAMNVDLVLGLPRQTPASFRDDVLRVAGLGADTITVYRFQPVASMTDEPPPALRFRRVFDAPFVARILAAGYVPMLSGGDEAFGVKLLRNTPRVRRWFVQTGLLPALRKLARREAALPVYSCFDEPRAHMLGLGPGALSHVYGGAWYREVTALASLGAGGAPVYWGSPLSVEEEQRTAVLRELSQGSWIDLDAVGAMADSDGGGAFVRRGRRMQLDARADDAAREAALDTLLPERVPDGSRVALGILALKMRKDVETRLLEMDATFLDALAADPCHADKAAASRRGSALEEWRRLLGVGRVGDTIEGARVVKIHNDDEIELRVEPKPAPPLRLTVAPAGEGPSYGRSARFAISYVARGGQALTEREKRFLDAVCARTQAADP